MNISAQHKIFSLKNKNDIERLLNTGTKKHTKYGMFFFGSKNNKQDSPLEFAVLIKKNVGNAVWRNYCKRIIREYVRKHADFFKRYKKVIYIYNYNKKINYKLLEKEINEQLNIL